MAAPVPPTGGRAPATWQTYVRNLDWFVTQANLKEEACNSGGVAQDDIVEVRLRRTVTTSRESCVRPSFSLENKDTLNK